MDREAIEEAIEVLEDASAEMLTETGNENYYGEAITILRQALAHPEQEPVASEHDRAVELGQAYERGWNAALAQREWVGLTDEEINSVRHKRDWTAPWTDVTFARAIEAKLREKNHG